MKILPQSLILLILAMFLFLGSFIVLIEFQAKIMACSGILVGMAAFYAIDEHEKKYHKKEESK